VRACVRAPHQVIVLEKAKALLRGFAEGPHLRR
jgi:hypothetical protein